MTHQEKTKEISLVCSSINTVIEASKLMKGYNFFYAKQYEKGGLNSFIKKTCKKHNLSEKHVRKILEL